jgi:hypothetical protein
MFLPSKHFIFATLYNQTKPIMNMEVFLKKLRTNPGDISFTDTMEVVEANYDFTPVRFTNGNTVNEAGTNSGSCKLFSFAKLHHLTKEETLACFGAYYREDVLQHPEATNHANIRNFMVTGWEGINFDADALKAKR